MPSVRLPEKGSQRPQHSKKHSKTLKRKRDEEELGSLEKRVQDFDLKSSPNLFSDIPLTRQTASALDKSHFKTLTDIQRKAIPLALKGRDVLGAAKTGSGKTLAFLIPVLEVLYRKKWTALDGVGALIISPTRELATQIFEVLRKVGREHMFSAGLVIGGKQLKEEQNALHRMNIVVCTPGRLLQHMDQTVGVNFENLQVLVLDEADRILDMGFKRDIDAIVANLPKERQTLLFSATQTQNVNDLARLSLRDQEYVSVHQDSTTATPAKLEQFYMLTPLPEKLDMLFAFLRNHLTAKILVFLSSCKQVRYVYETFRQLHIGIPLLHLHGKQKQSLRMDITSKFTASKNSCLFATDVVARGLDFPAVDWVIQLDCPEDAATYIHRVGRTARFEKTGRALLFLCPSETSFLSLLEAKKIPISLVNPKASKKKDIKPQLQALCFKDPELKYLGQKAFVSYARSISIQKHREIFDITKYPLEEYASSLGLPGAPRIRGLKSADIQKTKDLKNLPHGLKKLSTIPATTADSDSEPDQAGPPQKEAVRTKYDRMVTRANQTVLADHYQNLRASASGSSDNDEDGGFLTVKRRGYSHSPPPAASSPPTHRPIKLAPDTELTIDSNRRAKLLTSRKAVAKLKPRGQKLVFSDSEGEGRPLYVLQDEAGFKAAGAPEEQRERWLEGEKGRRDVEDEVDRRLAKEKRREKREKRKEREREIEAAARGVPPVAAGVYVPAPVGEEEGEWGYKAVDSDEEERPRKKGRVVEAREPETLEDLERLASGLLG